VVSALDLAKVQVLQLLLKDLVLALLPAKAKAKELA
jgi:hypothetical protein